jgi:phage recombination protein Bet
MNAVVEMKPKPKLLEQMAERFNVDPERMLPALKATAFKGDVSNEQMMALLIVANQHGLNPWTKEIYAFPDRGGIVPVVGVDGWSRIINTNPQFDGMDFQEAEDGAWIECAIHRKDRTHPVKIREWMAECKRDTAPWKSHPRRMLRHKAMIQCARLAFGFGGIYDPDEAERIEESIKQEEKRIDPRPDTSQVDDAVMMKWYGRVVDTLNMDKDEYEIAEACRDLNVELSQFPELYSKLSDRLAKDGIISKANWRKTLDVKRPESKPEL